MYVLEHFDWFGPIEELDELNNRIKKLWDGKDGVEFLGRFTPDNKNFHWTHFYKVKDMKAWANRKPFDWYKRDYKVHTHSVLEFYE
jgi:hypothetical protein